MISNGDAKWVLGSWEQDESGDSTTTNKRWRAATTANNYNC